MDGKTNIIFKNRMRTDKWPWQRRILERGTTARSPFCMVLFLKIDNFYRTRDKCVVFTSYYTLRAAGRVDRLRTDAMADTDQKK